MNRRKKALEFANRVAQSDEQSLLHTETMARLAALAKKASNIANEPRKERIALRNPKGGYRLVVRVIDAAK